MTEEEVKKIVPKAERITVLGDGTIGLKVGEFAKSVNLGMLKDRGDAERKIKDLYYDLQAMNRQIKEQENQARSLR